MVRVKFRKVREYIKSLPKDGPSHGDEGFIGKLLHLTMGLLSCSLLQLLGLRTTQRFRILALATFLKTTVAPGTG
jgi:hypothetical protein